MFTNTTSFRLIIVLVVLAILQPASAAYQAGDTAANFTAKIHGTNTNKTLYDYAGNIIVLDFFAYWCGPCRAASSELEPHIQQYYRDLSGNPSNIPVILVSINIDFNDRAQTDAYISTYGLENVLDDKYRSAFSAFGSNSIPQIAIVNGAANTNYRQWEVLYNSSGYGYGKYFTYREVINKVQSLDPAGSLQINFSPQHVIRDGARWNVDDGPWKRSGTTVPNLSTGTHTVNYKTLDGWWMTPPPEQVTITVDQTTTLNRTYRNVDLNQDMLIDYRDFDLLVHEWNYAGPHLDEDFDFDGVIGVGDMLLLAENWLEEPIESPGNDDDFETGDFLKLDWELSGNTNWTIDAENYYQGDFSARSGNVDDDQSSILELTLDCTGFEAIEFATKVSSEYDWDFLNFYIDSVEVANWSGDKDWTPQSFPITPGIHTFKWAYEKDDSVSQGLDCGWIDNITLKQDALSPPIE